jgi:hypothetical protein
LLIASLGEETELHVARTIRNLWCLSLLEHTQVALSGAHGQGNVEPSLALLAGVDALGHELCKLAIKVGLEFWVALIFLALDNDLFVLLAVFAMRGIVSLVLLGFAGRVVDIVFVFWSIVGERIFLTVFYLDGFLKDHRLLVVVLHCVGELRCGFVKVVDQLQIARDHGKRVLDGEVNVWRTRLLGVDVVLHLLACTPPS